MTHPQGPGSPFQLLFSDDAHQAASLPEAFRQHYPGDWHIPTIKDRPYIYSNFAKSRDGRITFNLPEWPGGAWVLSIVALISFSLCLWWAYQHQCCEVPIIWSKLAGVAFGFCGGLITFVRRRKLHGKIS